MGIKIEGVAEGLDALEVFEDVWKRLLNN